MTVYPLLLASMTASGALMGGLVLAFRSPITEGIRIREEDGRKIAGMRLWAKLGANSATSVALLFGLSWVAYDWLFYAAAASAGRMLFEIFAVLALYDFLYYLAHRFLFHGKLMHRFHAVHHAAKYPQAMDSLYVHPVETVVGLVLLMGSTAVIGPVNVWSFGILFLIYSLMNILIHSGLDVPFAAMAPFNAMAKKHDRHHVSMKSGNYASITPICDHIFGTAE